MTDLEEEVNWAPHRHPEVEWRFDRFKDLSFTDAQAMVLAYAKDFRGNFVYHEDVARMLERAKEKLKETEARDWVFDVLS